MKHMTKNQLTLFDENINDVNNTEPKKDKSFGNPICENMSQTDKRKKDEGSGNPASMLGYFYQIYYALYFLLKDDDLLEKEVNLQIEVLDDINIEIISPEKFKILIQNKMLKSNSTMSNSSKDFWKTIRNWINLLNSETISLENTSLLFVITSKVSENSIPELLSQHPKRRNIRIALQEIENTIHKSESTDGVIQEAYKLFGSLDKNQKIQFLERIEVLYLSPSMKEIESEIKKLLKVRIRQEHLNNFYIDVNRWWLDRCVEHLKIGSSDKITRRELEEVLQDIRDKFTTIELAEYTYADIPEISQENITKSQFITQLKIIGYNKFTAHKRDYQVAIYNRNRWQENGLSMKKIEEYEDKLIGEWVETNENVIDTYEIENNVDIENNDCDEKILKEIGRKIFSTVKEKRIPLNNIDNPSILRGSYHILANKKMTEDNPDLPKVYWHPKFRERMKK